MKATVTVMLKQGVLDPQGEAVKSALGAMGFTGVEGARQGKVIELDLAEGTTEAEVHRDVREAAGQYRDRELPDRAGLTPACFTGFGTDGSLMAFEECYSGMDPWHAAAFSPG